MRIRPVMPVSTFYSAKDKGKDEYSKRRKREEEYKNYIESLKTKNTKNQH